MSDISSLSDKEEFEPLEPSLRNILEQTSLKWIFVGGKGGVGKTTNSCSLAVQLAKVRKSVLIISTDPAHNLSDAFAQKITKEPTLISGFDNLYAMEIDPAYSVTELFKLVEGSTSYSKMSEYAKQLPGVDEAMALHEAIKLIKLMKYSVVVFDTAPTGHTLRFLQMSKTMEQLFSFLNGFQGSFTGLAAASGVGGADQSVLNVIFERMSEIQVSIKEFDTQIRNPELATFVCVCISEFLSLYETERMIQELLAQHIDTHNIIVNQLLYPEPDSNCKQCGVRYTMQRKYLEQIYDLYEDFHITILPMLTNEVRGPQDLLKFSEMLVTPYQPETRKQE